MLLWTLGCADPTTPTPTGDTGHTGTPLPTGDCAADATDGLPDDPWFDHAHGELVFRSVPGYASLAGAFLDGPEERFQVEAERSGQCRLLTYAPSTCDPTCAPGDLCRDGACVTPPRRVAAGTLTLSGPVDLIVDPDGIRGYHADTTADLDRDAELVLEGTAGADVPAFVARTCPVVPTRPVGDWGAALAGRGDGDDVVLSWRDVQPDARIRLHMTTGIGTHGGISPVEVECEGPDTGALVLPGAFLDALYAEGWACGECGGNDLVRYRSGRIGETDTPFTSEAVTSFFHIPR